MSPSHIYRINVPSTYSGINSSVSYMHLDITGYGEYNKFMYGNSTAVSGSGSYYGCAAFPSAEFWWFGRWSALKINATIYVCSNVGNCGTATQAFK